MKNHDAIRLTSALAICYMKMQGAIESDCIQRIRTAASATQAQHESAVEVVEAINLDLIREARKTGAIKDQIAELLAFVSMAEIPRTLAWARSYVDAQP